jgi:hypothetical protein
VDIEWKIGKVTSHRFASHEPRPMRARAKGEARAVNAANT